MGNKLQRFNELMKKLNNENKDQSIVTLPGKYSDIFNKIMFIVFAGIAILPVFIFLLGGGSYAQLVLAPFGLFMAIQYRNKIKLAKIQVK